MISRFSDLTQYILGVAPRGIARWFEAVLAIVMLFLAGVFVFLLTKRAPKAWLSRFFLGMAMFLSVSGMFGFAYHLVFQHDPTNFKLNAKIDISSAFVPIEQERELLEKIDLHRQIIAYTLAALGNSEGESRLKRLAKHVSGEVRSTYLASLSLVIVSPSSISSSDEQDAVGLLIQETASEVRESAEREQRVAKSATGILSPIPAWDSAMEVPLEELVNMRAMLEAVLRGERPAISRPELLRVYVTGQNNEKLKRYMLNDLRVSMDSGDTVDLARAVRQISVREVSIASTVSVAAADPRRIIDFQYFSLNTIALVGFGDILPNSTCARALVCVEILVGTAILGFFLDKLLSANAARQKGEENDRLSMNSAC